MSTCISTRRAAEVLPLVVILCVGGHAFPHLLSAVRLRLGFADDRWCPAGRRTWRMRTPWSRASPPRESTWLWLCCASRWTRARPGSLRCGMVVWICVWRHYLCVKTLCVWRQYYGFRNPAEYAEYESPELSLHSGAKNFEFNFHEQQNQPWVTSPT